MKVAIITTDNRGQHRWYDRPVPAFGPAPEAIIAGVAAIPKIELHIVSCIRQPVKSPEKLAENVWFHSLHVPKIGWMRTLYWGCSRAVRQKIREIDPDIVHGQGTEHENGISAVRSGYPNVITLHGIMQEQARVMGARFGSFHWLAHRLENYALRRTAGVFCNSQFTEDCVRGRARKMWRVPNPLREEFFRPAVKSTVNTGCVLLNVGLVCSYKRQNELLEAARELHAEGLRFKLRFVGNASKDDPYAARFLNLIGQSPAFAHYDGSKSIDQVIESMDAASALVHVSSIESFGLVAAEALTRNLKVIGFRVGGLVDITKGVEGTELLPDEDWQGIKSALRRWIAKGAPKPTSAATTMRERYHPSVIGRRHLEIYREVLGRK